ncbi:glucose/mannose-6-phosphate isomerase [Actinocorallia herbida]|uniref:Glucose/mannose-6-phosphate isomerase n=1 Tax=Actinocorallia herbida TaxID=58109 RepID=A0A3N1D8Z4_9ACTN|nr:SIS domain-containing protein [Actinocorallia herbida]ROO90000.1 glucose/mannose-6-phosphate isomerase [Actinocorallia herbida]
MTSEGRRPEAGALDDPDALEAADRGGMLRLAASGAAQMRQAAAMTAEAGLTEALEGAGRPRAVVIVGPGSAGEVVAAICGTGCPVPVLTVAGDVLPGWIGATDLVCALGDESFDLAAQAVRRGAAVVGVGPADARLRSLATQNRLFYVPLPPPAGPIRALLWAQVVPLLLVLRGLGIVAVPDEVLEAAAVRLEDVANRCRPSGEPFVNPAKQIALELAGSLPMPWGRTPLELAAAHRLAAQFADNAKVPVALPFPGSLDAAAPDTDDFFRDRADEPESAVHLVLVAEGAGPEGEPAQGRSPVADTAAARGIAVSTITGEGVHPLERAVSLIGLCDYVSVYLALALGVDPTPVPARTEIEARIY